MLKVDATLNHLPVRREQIITLLESINQPLVNIPNFGTAPTSAFVLGTTTDQVRYSVFVYLRQRETKAVLVYVCEPMLLSADQYRNEEAEAARFAESMGFMMSNSGFRDLAPSQQDELMSRCPVFHPPHQFVDMPMLDLTEVAEEELGLTGSPDPGLAGLQQPSALGAAPGIGHSGYRTESGLQNSFRPEGAGAFTPRHESGVGSAYRPNDSGVNSAFRPHSDTGLNAVYRGTPTGPNPDSGLHPVLRGERGRGDSGLHPAFRPDAPHGDSGLHPAYRGDSGLHPSFAGHAQAPAPTGYRAPDSGQHARYSPDYRGDSGVHGQHFRADSGINPSYRSESGQHAMHAAPPPQRARPPLDPEGLVRLARLLSTFVVLAFLALGCATAPKGEEDLLSRTAQTQLDLAEEQLHQAQWTDAITTLNRVLEEVPDSRRALHDMGIAYISLGRDREAESFLKRAIEPDGEQKNSEAKNTLATLLIRLERCTEAQELLEQVLEDIFYPTPQFAEHNLARAEYCAGRQNEAIRRLSRLLTKRPHFCLGYLTVSVMAVEQSQAEAAISACDNFQANCANDERYSKFVSPENSCLCYLQKGKALAQLGDVEGARRSFMTCESNGPYGEECRRSLELIGP